MTISLTAHIQCRHFADVHKDNKHKSPLIKQFTDGYTADVVPRLFQYYILQLTDVSHQLLPKQSSSESCIWRRKILHKAEEKLHRHVFSFFSFFFFFSGCEASRAAFTASLTRYDVSNQAQPTATFHFHVQEPFLSLPHSQCQAGGTAVYYRLIADRND